MLGLGRFLDKIFSRLGAPAGASVSADIAAVQADLGNPSARANLTTLEAMLGNADAASASIDGFLRTGYSTSAITRNVDGSVLERQEALLQKTPLLMPYLVEFWQGPVIDAALWLSTIGGTGAVSFTASQSYVTLQCNAGGDVARLDSVPAWRVSETGGFGAGTIPRRFVMEWEIYTSAKANLGADFFMGFGPGLLDIRTTTYIVGFILSAAGGNLTTLSDNAGAEETNNVNASYPGDGVVSKYRIESISGAIKFYINGVLVATHVAQLPTGAKYYLHFYNISGAGVASTQYLYAVRAWLDDEPYV